MKIKCPCDCHTEIGRRSLHFFGCGCWDKNNCDNGIIDIGDRTEDQYMHEYNNRMYGKKRADQMRTIDPTIK